MILLIRSLLDNVNRFKRCVQWRVHLAVEGTLSSREVFEALFPIVSPNSKLF